MDSAESRIARYGEEMAAVIEEELGIARDAAFEAGAKDALNFVWSSVAGKPHSSPLWVEFGW